MTADALYMYAICRHLDPAALDGHGGLREQPLRVVPVGDLQAVVSSVDLREFGEDGLRRHLEDLPWLEEVARGHDHVVHVLADLAPTAPLRLATICLDEDGVRRRLEEGYDALVSALERVEGCREWSVKVLARPLVDAPAGSGTASRTGGGAAYLQFKKAEAARRAEGADRLRAVAEAVHAMLSSTATASRQLTPQDPRLSGHSSPMILNGAYLVDQAGVALFHERVRMVESEHPEVEVDVAGPWPAYSFATIETA